MWATYHKYAVESPGCYLVELRLQQSLVYAPHSFDSGFTNRTVKDVFIGPPSGPLTSAASLSPYFLGASLDASQREDPYRGCARFLLHE
jgi:hypothetical protein